MVARAVDEIYQKIVAVLEAAEASACHAEVKIGTMCSRHVRTLVSNKLSSQGLSSGWTTPCLKNCYMNSDYGCSCGESLSAQWTVEIRWG